jgi:hypothetical protein
MAGAAPHPEAQALLYHCVTYSPAATEGITLWVQAALLRFFL